MKPARHHARLVAALVAAVVLVLPAREAVAQTGATVASATVAAPDVGSEQERYDRLLQITAFAKLYPWSQRGLSPSEQDLLAVADSGHPWARSTWQRSAVHHRSGLSWSALPTQADVYFNSAFPYGYNDGPVWAGRGVTTALQTGIAARFGHLSIQLEPMVFLSQNAAFAGLAAIRSADTRYENEFDPASIDVPERFGPKSYGRFDPGQSTIRLDAGPVAAGFSTADQFWGPALAEPLLLGNNAAGFPHAFAGTAHPINIGIGTVHGRVVYGRLEESAFAPPHSLGASRFMSGAIGEIIPRGAPGLELGAARFFHSPWPSGGIGASDLLRPFAGILKQSLVTAGDPSGDNRSDNQLASVFFRWAFPASGFEAYGEYGREDHNWDLRDLWMNIDHDAAYVLGLQRVFRSSPSRWYVFRAEVLNSRISHQAPSEPQGAWYIHAPITQGHTEMGQVLAAPGGLGGGASTIALDRYTSDGRWTVQIGRMMRGEDRAAGGLALPDSADVMQTLGVERLVRRSAADFVFGANAVWDLNRDFMSDRFNLNLNLSARLHWP